MGTLMAEELELLERQQLLQIVAYQEAGFGPGGEQCRGADQSIRRDQTHTVEGSEHCV